MVKLTNIRAKENNDNVSANFAFSLINSVDNPKINTIKTPIRIPLATVSYTHLTLPTKA